MIYFDVIIFLFGLVVGSFLNCVIYRLEAGDSFFRGRSYCPHCKHTLSWRDLFPVFSFLYLQGKCRYCKSLISIQYPAVEVATGILFLLITNYQLPITNFQTLLTTAYLLITSCFLIIIFVYDLKYFIIPDRVLFPAILLVFIYRIWDLIGHWPLGFGFLSSLISGLLASLFFLSLFLFSRGRAMGFGDVKLAFFMGLFLGFPSIFPALFLAFFFGAIIGVGLISAGKKKIKSQVPFGPFLIAGTFIAFFWGQNLINWYWKLLT